METVLLNEGEDPDEKLFRESLADLDTKFSFPETLPDYFQSTNNNFSIIYLKIRNLYKHFDDDFKSFLLHLHFSFKVIC